jgi:DNA-binding transcriptional regulator YiaG
MTIKQLRQQAGMTIKAFSDYFEIPYRTAHNWDNGQRKCPEYLIKLMEYKLRKENLI